MTFFVWEERLKNMLARVG